MLKPFLLAATAILLAASAMAQARYPAILEGHAVLPALTLVPPPADAPEQLQISGRYAGPPGQHPATVMPPVPGAVKFEVQRSKGFEGIAASPDGKFLYPLLEGPLLTADGKPESKEGTAYLPILEFDADKGAYTGKSWKHALEAPTNSIGDFNLIDAGSGLIIERDDTKGDPALACAADAPIPDCFNVPARFKRIYKVDLGESDDNELIIQKVTDLLKAK